MNLLPSVVDTPPRQLPAHPTRPSLQAFFEPESVAVIGASRARGTIGAEIFHNLLATGFHGCVFPVNPYATSVQGVRAYASLRDVPGDVDLAIVAVPASAVEAAVDDCIARQVPAVIVISAGFSETGEEGRRRDGRKN